MHDAIRERRYQRYLAMAKMVLHAAETIGGDIYTDKTAEEMAHAAADAPDAQTAAQAMNRVAGKNIIDGHHLRVMSGD